MRYLLPWLLLGSLAFGQSEPRPVPPSKHPGMLLGNLDWGMAPGTESIHWQYIVRITASVGLEHHAYHLNVGVRRENQCFAEEVYVDHQRVSYQPCNGNSEITVADWKDRIVECKAAIIRIAVGSTDFLGMKACEAK